jgi:putative hydrolase of the HAD superfamily
VRIAGILFDFGGVLAPFFRPDLFRALENELRLQPGSLPETLWRSDAWRLAEVGAIDDEEYWRRTAPRLGLSGDTEQANIRLRALREALYGDVEVDLQMVGLVRRLGTSHRIGLLSNTSERRSERMLTRHGLEGLFDTVVLSAAVGLAKPDPAIYRLAVQRLGTEPESTIFVDDSRPNVAAASEQGLHGLHFTGYPDLVVALERLGVTTGG